MYMFNQTSNGVNKKIIVIILVVVGLLGLMWWGRVTKKPVGAATGEKSTLVAVEKFYDFGTISMKNGNVSKDFTVTNPGETDIFIPSLETSCMCTRAYIVELDGSTRGPFAMKSMGYVPQANEMIKAGESRTIRVVYDPNAHGPAGVGPIDRFAILTDRSGGTLQF